MFVIPARVNGMQIATDVSPRAAATIAYCWLVWSHHSIMVMFRRKYGTLRDYKLENTWPDKVSMR
jgi:hypothetical protein